MTYQSDTILFRKVLLEYFDKSELKTLCFDLGMDYEDLSGATTESKVIEIYKYLYRHKRSQELFDYVVKARPFLSLSSKIEDCINNKNYDELKMVLAQNRGILDEVSGSSPSHEMFVDVTLGEHSCDFLVVQNYSMITPKIIQLGPFSTSQLASEENKTFVNQALGALEWIPANRTEFFDVIKKRIIQKGRKGRFPRGGLETSQTYIVLGRVHELEDQARETFVSQFPHFSLLSYDRLIKIAKKHLDLDSHS